MAQQENAPQTKGNILLVDDETAFLKIMNLLLSKHYNVKTAESGEDGLQILKDGFQAEVIISDQRMPGMSGAEFLEQSIKIIPNAVRVILTGYSTPKDLIPAINQAHAYMYLLKPVDELALIQAVKISLDNYNSNKKNRQLMIELKKNVKDLESKTEYLKKALIENQEMFTQGVQALSGISNYSERYYFTSHSKNVIVVAKELAEELNMTKEMISQVVMIGMLHTSVYNNMPVRFMLVDPHDIADEAERKLYFENFNKTIEALAKVKKLRNQVNAVSQLWEHHDGTGMPNRISDKMFSHEAQIISIANYYHNNVYRLTIDQYRTLRSKGEVVQTIAETKARHDECIKSLYRRATWYDYDVFNLFQDLVKKRAIPSLVPAAHDLKVTNIDLLPDDKFEDETLVEDDVIVGSDQITISHSTGQKMVEKEIPVQELEVGMMMGQTVLTKNNMLVVRHESVLDASTVKNLKQLESGGMVPSYVTVLMPVAN